MNKTLLTDFYQLTMLQCYYKNSKTEKKVTFDMFYRNNPFDNGYVVFAGLQQVIDYVKSIKFSKSDIKYLKKQNMDKDFLKWLKNFEFEGDIYSVQEGTVIFPGEPFLSVSATLPQAQFIETTMLSIINHQSLIATKASRIVYAANDISCMEFGLRRAQCPESGYYGARASYIGGFASTSNVKAAKDFNIPVSGTMSHALIMSCYNELDAFREYASTFPDNVILLVDTYNTIKSGIPNAIKVFDELVEKYGPMFKNETYGIRIDSGDLAELSKDIRKMLNNAGHHNAKIIVSNDLDEETLESLNVQHAKIDVAGVGTKNITAFDCPALGGVYKLSSIDGEPKIKISENVSKITNPCQKQIYRIIDKDNMIIGDLIATFDEEITENQYLKLEKEYCDWQNITLKPNEFKIKKLLKPIIVNGENITEKMSMFDIREYCNKQKKMLWPAYLRLKNPHIMKVDISKKLKQIKLELLNK